MMAIAKLSDDDRPVGLGKVSAFTGISLRYAERLAIPLRNAALLNAVMGRGGGYFLAREPEEIKVGEIVETSIGRIAITECTGDGEACLHESFCNCRTLWALVNHRLRATFFTFTLAELIEGSWPPEIVAELQQANAP